MAPVSCSAVVLSNVARANDEPAKEQAMNQQSGIAGLSYHLFKEHVMSLKDVQKNWNEFGRTDPLWAILTVPDKKNNQWNTEEFFDTGQREIAEVMTYVGTLPVSLARRRALDFGCGVGRLTQALCDYFESCVGVDIAASMIKQARLYNRHGDRCQYFLNESNDLRLFADDTFDLVYSVIVLQHMAPRYSRKYIQEFFRVLAPGGLAIFQIPSELTQKLSDTEEQLPDAAFKAHLTLLSSPQSMTAGRSAIIRVKIENASTEAWPLYSLIPICVGNHWCELNGLVVINDDSRVNLPVSLGPNESCEVDLSITAPRRAGSYQVEIDLVQEHIAWFKDKGSATVAIDMPVDERRMNPWRMLQERISNRIRRISVPHRPGMEMHGIPRNEVISLLAQCQGQVLSVRPDQWAGPAWSSYTYYAVKAR
jgi:SAM-dependent methyltransferase